MGCLLLRGLLLAASHLSLLCHLRSLRSLGRLSHLRGVGCLLLLRRQLLMTRRLGLLRGLRSLRSLCRLSHLRGVGCLLLLRRQLLMTRNLSLLRGLGSLLLLEDLRLMRDARCAGIAHLFSKATRRNVWRSGWNLSTAQRRALNGGML